MKFSVPSFTGAVKRISPEKLPDNVAQEAVDCKLDSGNLEALHTDIAIQEVPTGTKTIYLYNKNGTDVWITSTNELDIVQGPVAGDTLNRILITGIDEHLRVTDSNGVASDGSLSTVIAGLPSGTAPTFAASGGTSPDSETTTYVYTFVREWADGKYDEGPPSAASPAADALLDDSVTVSDIDVPPAGYGITKVFIYRSQTDSEGVAQFRYQGSIDAGETTFTHSMGDDLLELIPSTTWHSPPTGISGLVDLANGCIAGFKGNEVFVSEPFVTHAFPVANQQIVNDEIVGLGSFGTYLVVLTKGHPVIINAEDPSAMAVTTIESRFPCVAKKGIVSTDTAVVYPSPSGLVLLDTAGARLLTQQIMLRDDWQILAPETFNAALYNNKYIAFHEMVYPANTIADYAVPVKGGIIVDLEAGNLSSSSMSLHAEAIYSDPRTDKMYYASDALPQVIYEFGGDIWGRKTFRWMSKQFTSHEGEVNMSAARVIGDFSDNAKSFDEIFAELRRSIAYSAGYSGSVRDPQFFSGALGGFVVNTFPLNGDPSTAVFAIYNAQTSVVFSLFVGKDRRFTKRITSSKPFRLPAGYKAREFSVELLGTKSIYRVDLATTMRELPSVQ